PAINWRTHTLRFRVGQKTYVWNARNPRSTEIKLKELTISHLQFKRWVRKKRAQSFLALIRQEKPKTEITLDPDMIRILEEFRDVFPKDGVPPELPPKLRRDSIKTRSGFKVYSRLKSILRYKVPVRLYAKAVDACQNVN